MFTPLHSSTNQKLFEKYSTSVIKVVTMQKYNVATYPSNRLRLKYPFPFSVSYVRAEVTLETEKNQAHSSSHYRVTLV